jgi:hypothetical protein
MTIVINCVDVERLKKMLESDEFKKKMAEALKRGRYT